MTDAARTRANSSFHYERPRRWRDIYFTFARTFPLRNGRAFPFSRMRATHFSVVDCSRRALRIYRTNVYVFIPELRVRKELESDVGSDPFYTGCTTRIRRSTNALYIMLDGICFGFAILTRSHREASARGQSDSEYRPIQIRVEGRGARRRDGMS